MGYLIHTSNAIKTTELDLITFNLHWKINTKNCTLWNSMLKKYSIGLENQVSVSLSRIVARPCLCLLADKWKSYAHKQTSFKAESTDSHKIADRFL